MKQIITTILFCLLAVIAIAQNTDLNSKAFNSVNEMSYDFVKKVSPTGNGLSTYLYGEPEIIEAVIAEQFQNASSAKAKNFKGVQSIEGAIFPDISPMTLDYYYRLEEDKNHPGKTRITFFFSAGNYNFLTTEKYPEVMKAAKLWVASLDRAARLSKINEQISAQEAVVTKATEELAKITGDGQKLAKDQKSLKEEIAKLQEKLAGVEKDIEKNNKEKETKEQEMEVHQTKMKLLVDEKAKL
jgi:hypothetical protein